MENEILSAIIAAVAAISGAVFGGLFPWLTQRDKKVRDRATRKIERFKKEVRARIALEKAAVEWIVELRGKGEEGTGVKRELRARAQEKTGLRPKLSESDLSD
jgi:hypothetical protein